MSGVINLKDWYQIDFTIVGEPAEMMQNISKFISGLKEKKVIDKWFFLYEYTNIRIRFKTLNRQELKSEIDALTNKLGLKVSADYPFEVYSEGADTFTNEQVVEVFANIMSELSELELKKIDGTTNFSNYNLVERLSHCIFNTVYGSNTERYLLLKRLGISFENENPEQTVLDTNPQIQTVNVSNISLGTVLVPVKKTNNEL